MDRVWGYSAARDTGTVTVHIRRLREKLEDDPSAPALLETVWGVGYRLRAMSTVALVARAGRPGDGIASAAVVRFLPSLRWQLVALALLDRRASRSAWCSARAL